jgi:multiple sugar transport system permease protein
MSKRRPFFNIYNNNPWGLFFTFFPVLILMVFMFFPILYSLFLSFTNADIHTLRNLLDFRFVGLQNFRTMFFEDQIFWKSVFNTFYFVAVGGPLTIVVSLLTALLLNKSLVWFKGIFRTSYFLPVVTTIVAVAVVWRLLYEPHFGLVNWLLSWVNISGPAWLTNPLTAMPAIIIMATWKNFGVNMIILIAGLQAIPRELYEAAQIDGADAFQQFRYITLPSLRPVLLLVVVMVTIGYLQLFAEPYIMTKGGPLNSTISMTMLVYYNGFNFFNLGYASAIAYVIFFLIAVLSSVQLFFLRSDR